MRHPGSDRMKAAQIDFVGKIQDEEVIDYEKV